MHLQHPAAGENLLHVAISAVIEFRDFVSGNVHMLYIRNRDRGSGSRRVGERDLDTETET